MTRQTLSAKDRPQPLGWREGESLEAVAPRLREWVLEMEAFVARIPPIEIITLPFVGGTTGLGVATDRPPLAVAVAGVLLEAAPGEALAITPAVDWIRAPGGFRIRSMQGLTSGTAYRVTFAVIGENDA